MSYDLTLFKPKPGLSAAAAWEEFAKESQRWGESVASGDFRFEDSPAGDAERNRLANVLKARNSKLEDSHPDASAFKNDPAVSEDLARWFASSLELNNPRNGIQIGIADDHVGITIPYHHKGRAARAVIDELWNYLSVLQSEGYLCYDGQLEVVLDLETDLSRLVDKYEEGVRFAEQTAPDLFKRQ